MPTAPDEYSLKGDHYVRLNDLDPFIKRVNQLRTEGLTTRDIARRLNVPVATLNGRLRKYREANK